MNRSKNLTPAILSIKPFYAKQFVSDLIRAKLGFQHKICK